MSETELQNLVINKLTQEQYDELVAQDLVNENEIYLTPGGASTDLINDTIPSTTTTYSSDKINSLIGDIELVLDGIIGE